MLKEVKFIRNVGRFATAKSTLADILRSLSTSNPAILAGRRTLGTGAPSKAVLRIGTQDAVFDNGTWTGPRPRIAVYDSTFINDNAFCGDIVSADHLRNQYGVVIGEE